MECGVWMRCDRRAAYHGVGEMRGSMRRFKLEVILLSLTIVLFSITAEASQRLSADAIEGRVVEAKSGIPLEGVIVAINWELLDANDLAVAELGVAEQLTDHNGRFSFPAWGPVAARPGSRLNPRAPQMLLFKEGYRYLRLTNRKNTGEQHLVADWNGRTLEMRSLPPDAVANLGPGRAVSKHSLSINGLSIALAWAYHGKDCEWKQIPRMLVAVNRLKREFERQGLWTDLKSIDDLPASKKCGNPRDVLRGELE